MNIIIISGLDMMYNNRILRHFPALADEGSGFGESE